MDAAQHMLRRRRNTFPEAFRQNAVVMNNFFSQAVPARLENYKKREKALWEDILPMLTGIESQFLAPWTGVEDVYWCQNYKSVIPEYPKRPLSGIIRLQNPRHVSSS